MKISKLSVLFLVATIVFALASTAMARPGDENLIIAEDFESGKIDYDGKYYGGTHDGQWLPEGGSNGNDIGPWRAVERAVTARDGQYYMKSQIGSDVLDMGGTSLYRTEMRLPPSKRVLGGYNVPAYSWVGKENWIGFSVYLPSNEYSTSPDSKGWDRDIILQWRNLDNHKGLPIELATVNENGAGVWKWEVKQWWITEDWGRPDFHAILGPVELDKWTDFVINVVWDYRSPESGGKGRMKVWKNGQVVIDRVGPTTYGDEYGPFHKFGIYKPAWKPSSHPEWAELIRTVYHDEYRLGDGSASYDLVTPGGSGITEPQPEFPAGTVEAEAGDLTSPMQTVSDAGASGGSYIETAQGDSGNATYTVNIETSGVYKVAARVFAGSASYDSFHVNIDGQGEFVWDLNPTNDPAEYDVWREDDVTNRGAGTFDNPQFDPYTIELSEGVHTITFRGREKSTKLDYFSFSKVGDVSSPQEPVNNSAPTQDIVSPGDSSVFDSGSAIIFMGAAVDPEDGDLSADSVWVSNVDGEIGRGGNFSAILSEGAHTITASVTDSGGLTASSAIDVVVNAPSPVNSAPTQEIVSPGDGSVFDSGSAIVFEGAAVDPEDGDLSANSVWVSNIDGEIGRGGNFSVTLSEGTHTITASVTDSAGAIGSSSIGVTVKTPSVAPMARVNQVAYSRKGKNLAVTAYLIDEAGKPVRDASVSLEMENADYGSSFFTGTTDRKGKVTFNSMAPQPGSYTATVLDVYADGFTWDGQTPENIFWM